MQTQTQIRDLLEASGLAPQKAFGQNFLVDLNLMAKLVEMADVQAGSAILEVGPGTGSLTEELLQRAGRVVAVEIDRGLATLLGDTFAGRENFQLINADVLAGKHEIAPAVIEALGPAAHLVSNLPYNIATPLIALCLLDSWASDAGILPASAVGVPPASASVSSSSSSSAAASAEQQLQEQRQDEGRMPSALAGETPTARTTALAGLTPARRICRFESLTFTVQREVADRLVAPVDSGAYGPISVMISLLSQAKAGPIVPASAFWPRPAVASRIMRIDFDPAKAAKLASADALSKLLSLSFGQRRKQIGAIIRRDDLPFTPTQLADALSTANVDPKSRAEQLPPDVFLKMANHLAIS